MHDAFTTQHCAGILSKSTEKKIRLESLLCMGEFFLVCTLQNFTLKFFPEDDLKEPLELCMYRAQKERVVHFKDFSRE